MVTPDEYLLVVVVKMVDYWIDHTEYWYHNRDLNIKQVMLWCEILMRYYYVILLWQNIYIYYERGKNN